MSAALKAAPAPAPAPKEMAPLGIRRGESALVTGASSGIGEAFARTLAGRGVALLITGLPAERDRLDAIAAELIDRHGIRCEALPMDLSAPDGPDRLCAAADALGFEPDLLVNSAGVWNIGRFAHATLETELRMVQVNVAALVALTGFYVPRMSERGGGAVINIASTAAFHPLPYFSVYAASKAFVVSFGEALWAEGRRSGVRVVNVCSGPVDTSGLGAGAEPPADRSVRAFLRRRYLTTDRLVASAIAAAEDGRPMVLLRIPFIGLLARPLGVLRGMLPLRWQLRLSERLNRWLFGQQ